MQDLKNSVKKSRITPDYTGDAFWAKQLARKVQDYYHERGFTDVRCWTEPELSSTGRKLWGIRSNIIFSISHLHSKTK